MNLTKFYAFLFSILLLSIANSTAQTNLLRTKDFQLIVNYYSTTTTTLNADTFEIPKIKDEQNNSVSSGYSYHEEEAEGGPYVLITINGHCNFTDKRGGKLCFSFSINSSSARDYSRVSCSLTDCIVEANQEYSFNSKINLVDIFENKLPLINITDKNRYISLYLVIKK